MTTEQITNEAMMTAMCIAEYKADCEEGSAFCQYIDNYLGEGAWGLREEMAVLAVSLDKAFDTLGETKRTAFQEDYLDTPCWDYSVVPWVCEKAAETGSLKISQEVIIGWVEAALATLPKETME